VAWDKKYRPQTFSDVLGQDGTVQVLKARVSKGTGLDTSYVFSGPAGTGKTTTSRILARALLCTSKTPDGEPCNECDNCQGILDGTSAAFRELDAASSGTIDNVRRIVDDLAYAVMGAAKRIILFDEMHRMSRDSQDVLLKPLEEKRLIGIFCTTEPLKIRPTISSRCETHTIRFPTREEITGRVKRIMDAEGVTYEEEGILTAVDYCGGHVRDVLNRLEMVAQMGPVTLEAVRNYLDLGAVSQYYDVLLALGNPPTSVALVEDLCDRVGPEEVLSGLAEAAMNSWRLANKMVANFAQMDRVKAQQVHAAYGDTLLGLAEYFLATRRPSTLGVVCSVVACQAGVPAVAPTLGAVPVLVQATYQAPATHPEAPATAATAPSTADTAQSTNSTPQTNNLPAKPSQLPPPPAKSQVVLDDRTVLERRATPAEMPRGANRPAKQIAASPVAHHQLFTLSEARESLLKAVGKPNGGLGST
jgi:DNA polymerase III subunit gamma/tau